MTTRIKSRYQKPLPHREEMEARKKRQLSRQPSLQGDLANGVVRRRRGLYVANGKYNVRVTEGKR